MFKIIIRDLLYNMQKNDILTSPQSGLIPDDASVNLLAFLYTVFCQAFDTGDDIQSFSVTQGNFLCCFNVNLTGTLLLWFTHYFSRVILPKFTSN